MDEIKTQQEINKYKKFKKVDGATYRKVNQFLRKRTYITAREWALARLCTDFRTSGGAEMTFIGKHLPELVPFMEDTYTPQAVNQARNSFKKKVRKASATFFYGAMCGFFTTDELDDLLFEASEVARFLLEVEGTTLNIDDEIDIEDRITNVMRSVGEAAKTILKTRAEAEADPSGHGLKEKHSRDYNSIEEHKDSIVIDHDRNYPDTVSSTIPINKQVFISNSESEPLIHNNDQINDQICEGSQRLLDTIPLAVFSDPTISPENHEKLNPAIITSPQNKPGIPNQSTSSDKNEHNENGVQ